MLEYFSGSDLEPCPVSRLLQFHDRYLEYLMAARERELDPNFTLESKRLDSLTESEERKQIIEVNYNSYSEIFFFLSSSLCHIITGHWLITNYNCHLGEELTGRCMSICQVAQKASIRSLQPSQLYPASVNLTAFSYSIPATFNSFNIVLLCVMLGRPLLLLLLLLLPFLFWLIHSNPFFLLFQWEFSSQDSNQDGILDEHEIEAMIDRDEDCMVGFMKSCDYDHHPGISRREWNTCFPPMVAGE